MQEKFKSKSKVKEISIGPIVYVCIFATERHIET